MTLKERVAHHWECFSEEVTTELQSQEVVQTEGTARENYFFSFFPSFFDSCTGLVLWPQFELDDSLYHGETNMTNLKIMVSFFFFK